MTYYLLAAEADQIQELVFSSSLLREVVGASQMLASFCEEIEQRLINKYELKEEDILVCRGGAFRIRFTDEDNALAFHSELPNLYFLYTGATLTVAGEPIVYQPGGFKDANTQAHRALRRAKAARRKTSACSQLPYVAVCASCGLGMAREYAALPGAEPDDSANYLCASCREKGEASNKNTFLQQFEYFTYGQVVEAARKTASTTESIGRLDSRNYVSYLKADLNSFGTLVQNCDSEDTLKALSRLVDDEMRRSLAEPAALVVDRANEVRCQQSSNEQSLPVLPLIMAGDDCFILLPAPWSIDYTQRFCDKFSSSLTAKARNLNLLAAEQQVTIAAALIICKASYPHKLAHQRAGWLLEDAKRHAKRSQPQLNAIQFEVVNNAVAAQDDETEQHAFLGTLKPYSTAYHEASVTLPLSTLVEQRACLAVAPALPAKRRAELRALYQDLPKNSQGETAFQKRLSRIRDRIVRMENTNQQTGSATLGQRFKEALKAMAPTTDAEGEDTWGYIKRDERFRSATGMPDLIEVWRYSLSLEPQGDV